MSYNDHCFLGTTGEAPQFQGVTVPKLLRFESFPVSLLNFATKFVFFPPDVVFFAAVFFFKKDMASIMASMLTHLLSLLRIQVFWRRKKIFKNHINDERWEAFGVQPGCSGQPPKMLKTGFGRHGWWSHPGLTQGWFLFQGMRLNELVNCWFGAFSGLDSDWIPLLV